ncbi:MAG: hypothetical protein F2520_04685 [Actinobacteria bacterium]|uniref:Unannotated protein n=1 Tax=freshwater metagenome TaxID=449393 RepID=A0A6J7IJQ8_9ZZZZ|nr:hypothetical protein [Actinomycetota bacterium]MTA77538.1 hypothetical protein [Actinomycetota bacterium]
MTIATLDRSRTLQDRLSSCIPGATFELEAFLRLVEIRETTDVPTAAVTTGATSKLLLNPDFVEKYCRHDEHLFLLVMHELWHVLFAHTRFSSAPTAAENIAFDAIINAELTQQFPEIQYRGFFEEINPVDSFPGRLLRAPEGWPNNPNYRGPGPRGTAQILARLYPVPGKYVASPTYSEIVKLVEAGMKSKREGSLRLPSLKGNDCDEAFILGDHTGENQGRDALANPLMRSALSDVTKSWPSPQGDLAPNAGLCDATNRWIVAPVKAFLSIEQAMEVVLRRACTPARQGVPRRDRVTRPSKVQTPIPAARDRQRAARKQLGIHSLLWNSEVEERRIVNGQPGTVLVYLDVSGSMSYELPRLIVPLRKFVERGLATTWQFSTIVEPLPLEELRLGQVTTTGGTAVISVLEHALQQPNVSSVVLVSDGFVEETDASVIRKLRDRGITIESVVCAGGSVSPLDKLGFVTKLVDQ